MPKPILQTERDNKSVVCRNVISSVFFWGLRLNATAHRYFIFLTYLSINAKGPNSFYPARSFSYNPTRSLRPRRISSDFVGFHLLRRFIPPRVD